MQLWSEWLGPDSPTGYIELDVQGGFLTDVSGTWCGMAGVVSEELDFLSDS